MNINDFSINVMDNILIITNKTGVSKEDAIEIKLQLEHSTGHIYNYVLYRDCLGYFKGLDFLLNIPVYCSTINRTYARQLMLEHISLHKFKDELRET